ncbi:MAG: hypothetical protein MJZ30_11440 [Paludibacteraceae bacterium]|nr:hypothetical protein [Paludibacteraceae bacterium]
MKNNKSMFLFGNDGSIKAALIKVDNWIKASDLRASGKVVWIIAAGVIPGAMGIEPMRVPTRIECLKAKNGNEDMTLMSYCRLYKELNHYSHELDFYVSD